MLQGHPSRFWGELRDGLVADGHRVLKIHLCLADLVYWGRRPAISYRGRYRNWRAWIERYLIDHGVTDILYYADRLPYHSDALDAAKGLGIRCLAIEFGYLRPDWITMEPEGMGARSTFPKDPDAIRALAAGAEAPNMVNLYPYDFATEAFHEVNFHLLQAFGRPVYPLYNSDKIYWPAIDYLSWLGQLAFDRSRKRDAERLQAQAESDTLSYNLVAMQIQADYQIRCNSPYAHLSEFLEEVFASFARSAPASRHLVVKLHPLDNGLERWFLRIPRLARKAGIGSRVHVVRGGELSAFLRHSQGAVLVNSTVGLHALRLGIPTYAAGEAVFDVSGLTHQGSLDAFWDVPDPVDTELFHAFERALTAIQIKGSFYNRDGRLAAIGAICERIGEYPSLRSSR